MNGKPRVLSCARGLGLACLVGCAHAPAATPPTAADTNPSGDEMTDYQADPVAAQSPPSVFIDSVDTFMLGHSITATWARDAVVDGNIERIRTPLNALAAHGYENVVPGSWTKGIAQLQATARLTARAQTIQAAASGIAAMGRMCGECHRAQGGPELQLHKPAKRVPKSDSFEDRMFRHAWAVERLWEGLTVPSDDAWAAGASALSAAPSAAPKTRAALPPKVVQTLEVVRGLGVSAMQAESAEGREKLYGALLVTCAECHHNPPGAR